MTDRPDNQISVTYIAEIKAQLDCLQKGLAALNLSLVVLMEKVEAKHKAHHISLDRVENILREQNAAIFGEKGIAPSVAVLENEVKTSKAHIGIGAKLFMGVFALLISILGMTIWGNFHGPRA